MGTSGNTGLLRQLRLLKRSPRELKILYVLNFLNSYKYFSMALVLPMIATQEYGFTDLEAGGLYGMWGLLITFWGFIASIMVDNLGVRTTAIVSMVCSIVGRAVFVFYRSRTSLLIVVYFLSPIGDGMFDPAFNVGLKKCTTDTTRPFAYALAYTVMNLGGAFSDNLTDAIRMVNLTVGGVWFSGLRCVLFSSLVMMVIALVVSCTLRELSDVEAEQAASELTLTPTTTMSPERGGGRKKSPRMMRRMDSPRWVSTAMANRRGNKSAPEPNSDDESERDPNAGFGICMNRNFWKVAVFVTAVLFVSQQWRFLDLLMPKYATRYFGETVPFANIASINLWGCVFLAPLLTSYTPANKEDVSVMLPGLWIMALAPLPMILMDSVWGVALWVALMTAGEVIWSPRSSSYAASLAPSGREGIFLMLSSWPTYLTKYPAGLFSGWLLLKFVPDCADCKDSYGHFCGTESGHHCVSVSNSQCSVATLPIDGCIQTCQECPGYEGDAADMWWIVLAMSLVSPIIVMLFYHFLKREVVPAHTYTSISALEDGAVPRTDTHELNMDSSATSMRYGSTGSSKQAIPRSSSSSKLEL